MKAIYSCPERLQHLLKAHVTRNLELWAPTRQLRRQMLDLVASGKARYGLVAFDNFSFTESFEYEGSYNGLAASNAIDRFSVPLTSFPDCLMASLLNTYLQQSPQATVIFDHQLTTTMETSRLEWCNNEQLITGKEIYHFISSEQSSKELCQDGLRNGGDRWIVGACLNPIHHAKLSEANGFDGIVDKCEHLFTKALDGMGYVTWSRPDLVPLAQASNDDNDDDEQ
jgi:hypothetical protein